MYKKKIYVWVTLILVLVVTPIFSGGTQEEGASAKEEIVEIDWMGGSWLFTAENYMDRDIPGLVEQGGQIPYMAYLFEQEYPNVKINTINQVWEGYDAAIKTMLKAKDLPELTNIHLSWMYDVSEMGGLRDLTGLVRKMGVDSFSEGALEATRRGDKYYGVPYRASAMAFYWDMNLFREAGLDPNTPPRTWEEVMGFSKQIKERTGKAGFALDAKLTKAIFNNLQVLIYSFGGQIVDKDNMVCRITDPPGLRAAEFIYELNEAGLNVPGALGLTNDDTRQLFVNGQVAMKFTGPWAIQDMKNLGKELGKDYGITTFPGTKAGETGYSPLIGWAFTCPDWLEPEKAKVVEDLIEFVLEPERHEWFVATMGSAYLPTLQTPTFQKPEMEPFSRQLPYTVAPILGVPHDGEIREILADAFQRLTMLKAQPKEAFTEASEKINELLKQ